MAQLPFPDSRVEQPSHLEDLAGRRCDQYRPRIRSSKDEARKGSDPVIFTTNVVIWDLARRIQHLNSEMSRIDQALTELLTATAPSLLNLYGVGPDTAASLLVIVGDNPNWLHSERSWAHLCGVTPIPASSGKVTRSRLNRGGDRYANAALHRIVLTRMSSHDETRRYVTGRRAEGLNTAEIMRCLKRYVARQVFNTCPKQPEIVGGA